MIIEILVLALVAYRIWRLIGQDEITAPARARIHGWLLTMVECPWCLGTWITLGLALLGSWLGYISHDWLIVGLAAACLVGLIGSTLDRN